MKTQSPVEIADHLSHRRPIGIAIATAAFLLVQLVAPPFFAGATETMSAPRATFWAVNAVILLALLATRGGLIYRRRVRALVNDEITRNNHRTALVAGYWVAMTVAMGVFVAAGLDRLSAREAVYLVVTPSVAAALFLFSYLERRALLDA
jgi:hypothetical protein